MYAKSRAEAMTSALSAGVVEVDAVERGTKKEHAELRSAKQAMLDRLSRRGFTAKAQRACRCGMKVETRECVALTCTRI
ncbi:hypothetical protein PTKU46_50320 [Paraburkholderia terrae]